MKISAILRKALTVLAIGFVALASNASADVLLVNTFGQGTDDPGTDYGFTSPLSSGKSVAQQFKTVPVGGFPGTAGFYNITGVSINMFRASTGSGTLDLAIYSNVQGTTPNNKKDTPGTLVASLGSYAISGLSTTSSNVITASDLLIPTNLNTIYWIVASVSGGTGSVAFNSTTNSMSANAANFGGFTPISSYINPPGQPSWYIEGSQDAYTIKPIVMSVTVPEPSTYALGALSAIALGVIGRRKRLAKTSEVVAAPEISV
jgi:hypothetical protein